MFSGLTAGTSDTNTAKIEKNQKTQQKEAKNTKNKDKKTSNTKKSSIKLTYGENNRYSTKDQDSDETVYEIPKGEYKVTMSDDSDTDTGTVLVEEDKATYQKVTQYVFSAGESQKVTVSDGQQVTVSEDSSWEFDK